jgi:osmotically-inducible protein OsmY
MLIRLALTLALIGVIGCGQTIDTTIADAQLTAAVKTALLNADTIDGTLVSVRTEGGVVYLQGAQPSAGAAAEVVSIVRRVNGVRDVQASVTVDTGTPVANPSVPQQRND